MPICLYSSCCVRGSSTASRISCFWMSLPPMSCAWHEKLSAELTRVPACPYKMTSVPYTCSQQVAGAWPLRQHPCGKPGTAKKRSTETACLDDGHTQVSMLLCQGRMQDVQLTVYATSGRSDWVSSEMEESASGGRMSTSALECRCSAMEALGLSSSRFSVDRMRT